MNTTYPLIPVIVLVGLTVLATTLMSRSGMLSRTSYSKFWNIVLFVAFLLSGLTGFVSVVKIAFKLSLPHYEQFIWWHVLSGMVMVPVALIHLSWHLRYYFSGKTRKNEASKHVADVDAEPIDTRQAGILLFLLGWQAMTSQVVLIREFMSVFGGNEIIQGLALSFWMMLTGWGAFQSRRENGRPINLNTLSGMMIVLPVLAAFMLVLLYLFKSIVLPAGLQADLFSSMVGVVIILFPVCFLSGYLFTRLTVCLSDSKKQNQIGKAYSWESLGSLAAGIVLGVFLGRYFNALQILSITFGLTLLSFLLFRKPNSRFGTLIRIVFAVLIPFLAFILRPDDWVRKLILPNQELVLNQSSRYGNLVVTRQAGQLNFYENLVLQFYTDNLIESEEAVHVAMVQHENPRKVLLLSGGLTGMIGEIRKYPSIESITYLESNPEIFSVWHHLAGVDDQPRLVKQIGQDIRFFLQKSKIRFDVILINLPPPTTLALNRFFTDEFFSLVKVHCQPEAVVCVVFPSTDNYAGYDALKSNGIMKQTLKKQFKNLMLFPGEKNYFVVSDRPLTDTIARRIGERGILTSYVNTDFIDDELIQERSRSFVSQLDVNAPVNHDFKPVLFVQQINHWLSRFKMKYHLLVIIPGMLFFLIPFGLKPVPTGLYVGGFTSVSLELVLMLAFQIYFGSLYRDMSLFFAAFMGGLALGASVKITDSRYGLNKLFAGLQYALAILALLLPLFVRGFGLALTGGVFAQVLFYVLVLILAGIIGVEFNLASKLSHTDIGRTTGENYGADLLGAAFGAYLTAIFLIPVLGLEMTCVLVAGLNVLSGTMAFFLRYNT